MTTPYTTKTGIKIGSRYRENGIRMPIDDPDMLKLQRALLLKPKEIQDIKDLDRCVLCCLAVIVLIVLIIGETRAEPKRHGPQVLHGVYDQGDGK